MTAIFNCQELRRQQKVAINGLSEIIHQKSLSKNNLNEWINNKRSLSMLLSFVCLLSLSLSLFFLINKYAFIIYCFMLWSIMTYTFILWAEFLLLLDEKRRIFSVWLSLILYSWTNLCIQELGPFVCILDVNKKKKEITFEAVEHNSGCRTMYIWSPWLSSLYISWFLCQVHKAYVEFTTCIKKWKGN
jgi:hypothetical protein